MSDSREVYKARVDAALLYLNENLAGDLDLACLAEAAHFSAFHFHRIFSVVVGETPQQFLIRIRLEKAANMLVKNPIYSITSIAAACGFSSAAIFARSFKKHFGLTANQYRQTVSKPTFRKPAIHIPAHELEPKLKVDVRHMPALNLAYVSNLNGYTPAAIDRAWDQLCRWASARDLLTPATCFLGIAFDDPLITPTEKCRYYACITIPGGTTSQNPIGQMQLPAGKCAVARVSCSADEIPLFYLYLYHDWLIDSGYQPADQPPYEIYYTVPDKTPDGKYTLDICIPVLPL